MRSKGGTTRKQKHKKILKSTKGYRMTKSKLYKVAHEAYLHAGQYAHAHRKRKHSQMRALWIKRINAAARENGLKYSAMVGLLKKSEIRLNKKVLSDISLNHPEVFTAIVKEIQK